MSTTLLAPRVEEPPRKKRRKWWIPVAVFVTLLAGFIGFRVYGAVSLLNSGERVDIGGRSIFLKCTGTGSPTVILEHGLGSLGFDWEEVQASVDDTTRVCYTSRAGMGFSDRPPAGVRTMQDAVDDLTAVLDTANVSGPYVMVGHSAGGYSVRMFADQHPGEVVGMVLVDTTHHDMTARIHEEVSVQAWDEVSGFLGSENAENLDLEASSAQAAAAGDLGDMPLVVLQAGMQENEDPPPGISQAAIDELDALLATLGPELQQDLARLSTNSRLVVVEDAGHFIHVDRPDAVIEAILSVLPE